MTTDQVFTSIQQQNEIIISLLARLVWTPEKIAAIVTGGKRNPEAYVSVYNALDGTKTGKELAVMAGVAQPTMSVMLQSWLDDGIVLNVGTDSVPKYKRLMRIPETRKRGKRDTDGTNGQ
jgi:hypothetical protein